MNTLLRWIEEPVVRQIGWVLLHSLWQGALIGALFELTRFALRRCSANARYIAGCVALAFLLAAPIATLWMQSKLPSKVAPASSAAVGDPSNVSDSGLAFNRGLEAPSHSVLRTCADVCGEVAPWLTPVWLVGVVFFSFKLTRSWWWVGKIRTQEHEPLDAGWLEKLDQLRRRLGISRPVRLVQSMLVEVPTVVGWLRPVILLPAASLAGLTPGQLEAILAHELAHVRRLDYVVNAFQCVIETLLFYHPMAWWISRCVREERENCCDDLVIEVCGDRLAYARALTTLEEFRAVPDFAFAASGGSLTNRIRRLLGMPENGPSRLQQFSGLTLLGVGLTLIVLGAVMNASAPTFEARSRIRVERDTTDVNPGKAGGGESPAVYDPYFIQTEFEVIQSEAMLSRVVDALNLQEVWGKQYNAGQPLKLPEAITLLKRRLDLHPVRNTTLIEIHAYGADPDEAARLANVIAETYRERRQRQIRELMSSGVEALKKEWNNYETNLAAAYAELDELRVKLNVSDPDPFSTQPTPVMSADTLRQLRGQMISMETDQVRIETQLTHLEALAPSERRSVIQTAVGSDAELTSLTVDLNQADKSRLEALKEFGDKHPTVQGMDKTLQTLNDKIDRRVEGIMLGLKNRCEAGRATIAKLKEKMEMAKEEDLHLAEKSRPYYKAKQRLEQTIQFRAILANRFQSLQTDAILPRSKPVEIIDRASPINRPVSPNRPRAIAVMALGAFLSVLGFTLLRGKSSPQMVLSPA